jgi:hypothetical protein
VNDVRLQHANVTYMLFVCARWSIIATIQWDLICTSLPSPQEDPIYRLQKRQIL